MKTTSVLLPLALAGAALAQFQGLPSCATTCADQYFGGGGYGNCGSDVACICADKNFIGGVACCLASACDAADQASAVTFAQQLCTGVGVSVPSAVSCTSSATGAAGTGATTTPSSAAATTTPVTSGSSTSAGTASTSASSTANPTANTASTSSHNYGPRPTAAGFGVIGGLVAAVAML